MGIRLAHAALSAGVALLLVGATAAAQPLGTFTWQLQPFCNVVTVNVTQQGAVYTMDGYDGQCGAAQRAPLVGLATPNSDGTIGLGLHVVTVPGGRGVQIDARITLAALSGTWTDSAGNAGSFAFNANTGGSPRPAPTIPGSAIAAGSISALQLAPGAIGATQINAGQVQARVGGTCAGGQALRGVNPDGTVVCTDALTTVDAPASNGGNFSSVAIGTDGLPVIAHHDATLGAVRVTHCGNAAVGADDMTDDRQTVRANGDRGVMTHDVRRIVNGGRDTTRSARGVAVVGHPQRAAVDIAVAHDRQTGNTDGNRRVEADVVGGVVDRGRDVAVAAAPSPAPPAMSRPPWMPPAPR